MRAAPFVLLALLAPPAVAAPAWSVSVDAPERAASGLPFYATACATAAPGGAVEFRVAPLEARYGHVTRANASGVACADIAVEPDDIEGDLVLTVKARPFGGSSARAQWSGAVALARTGVASIDCSDPCALGDFLVPAPGGIALVPRADAPRLVVESAWGAPFAGFVLRNDGPGEARLGGLALAGASLPDARLAEGARVFLGEEAPPGHELVPFAKAPRAGNATLFAAKRALDTLVVPKLAPGEVATREGVERAGRTRIPAVPIQVAGDIEAFATPDAGAAPLVDLIDSAREEVLVESYTMTSPEVGAALARALARGVAVRVLLEGAPVGGVPPDEGALVAALVVRGADVAFLRSAPGFPARYATLHAKVVVVDRALVLVATENPHASSFPATPGAGLSRGFGLVVHDARVAAVFADAFEADAAAWPDVQRPDLADLPPPAPLAAHAGASRAPTLRHEGGATVMPILSPDAPTALVEAMRGARERIDVEMLFADAMFGAEESPLVAALEDAARRGVAVRILLDARHDEGRNAALVERMNALAAREGLVLEARLAEASRTLHAKLVLLDGERAYVGSMNWGRAAWAENREAGLLVDAPVLARFFEEEFEKDRRREAPAPAEREVSGAGGWAIVLTCLPALLRRRRA